MQTQVLLRITRSTNIPIHKHFFTILRMKNTSAMHFSFTPLYEPFNTHVAKYAKNYIRESMLNVSLEWTYKNTYQ